ncbi:MAG: HEPN domain-containing protein [Acidimicrobiales bacterium]
MSAPSPEEIIQAQRWLTEAGEELAVAAVIAADPELPGRVSCFHAHLAAEKAMKALQIRRGVLIRKIHNLVQLASQLPEEDQRSFEFSDLSTC